MSSDPTSSLPGSAQLPQPREQERSDWHPAIVEGVVIVLAVFAVYWRALRGKFLWDDFLVVHRNPLVTGQLTPGSIWFHTDFPLSNVVFWLQWLAWGDHPLGYHVVNALFHATSTVLLWRVLERLRVPASWLAALIFAVHPLCVASVAWISELKNALSLPFYLLSLLWYLRLDSAPRTSDFRLRSSTWYCLSLLAFLLALFSKTSTVMLPVVLLTCAWWQRGRLTPRDWLLTSPFFAFALAFGLMSIWFQAHGAITGGTVQSENLWGRLAGAGMALWFYLGKALLPVNLSMIYPRWHIDAGAAMSYLPLLLWCGLLALCWVLRRTWGRHVLFGLGCFIATLFPVLGFFDMYFLTLSRVSDHFAYLPLTALVGLAAGGLACGLKRIRLLQPGNRELWCVGGGLAATLAVLAGQRAQVFRSEETLWHDTLAKNPNAWCAHANLGWILASQQKYDEAREHLEASLALKSDNAQAHSNLGRVLSLQGRFAEGDSQFQAALKLKPRDADIRKSYAAALVEQGKPAEAIEQLRAALHFQPDARARTQLAALLYQTSNFRDAIAEYRQALVTKPDEPEALNNLAWLLATCSDATLRDGREAVRLAERACQLSGYNDARTLGTLAAAYAEAGRFTNAVPTAERAIQLARAAGDTQLASMGAQLLSLFRAGKPYHESPSGPIPPAAR